MLHAGCSVSRLSFLSYFFPTFYVIVVSITVQWMNTVMIRWSLVGVSRSSHILTDGGSSHVVPKLATLTTIRMVSNAIATTACTLFLQRLCDSNVPARWSHLSYSYSGPEVLFKTCATMKFVDDDDDDDIVIVIEVTWEVTWHVWVDSSQHNNTTLTPDRKKKKKERKLRPDIGVSHEEAHRLSSRLWADKNETPPPLSPPRWLDGRPS